MRSHAWPLCARRARRWLAVKRRQRLYAFNPEPTATAAHFSDGSVVVGPERTLGLDDVKLLVMLKYLRITVSALSLTACVLLSALWVRSYWRYDWLGGLTVIPGNNEFRVKNGCLIESANGALVVLYIGDLREPFLGSRFIGTSAAEPNLRVTGDDGESAWNGFRAKVYSTGMFRGSAPHWFFAILTGAVAAVSSIRCRFNIRALLIAMALVAVVLGIAVM